MLIATFGPSTGWVGKKIVYEGQRFVLEGYGEITAQGVLEYDRQAHLDWAYDGLREWVGEMAASQPGISAGTVGAIGTPAPASAGVQPPYRAKAANDSRPLRNVFVIGGIGLALVLAIIVIATVNSAPQAAQDSSGGSPGGGAASKPSQWILVASLSGDADKTGGVFSLQGGEQRLEYDIASTGVTEYGDMAMAGIYVMDAGTDLNTDGGFPEVAPDGGGADSTMMYRPAGDYYIAVNSANCNWAVNVYELH